MSYTPNNWKYGDKLLPEKMNKPENELANAVYGVKPQYSLMASGYADEEIVVENPAVSLVAGEELTIHGEVDLTDTPQGEVLTMNATSTCTTSGDAVVFSYEDEITHLAILITQANGTQTFASVAPSGNHFPITYSAVITPKQVIPAEYLDLPTPNSDIENIYIGVSVSKPDGTVLTYGSNTTAAELSQKVQNAVNFQNSVKVFCANENEMSMDMHTGTTTCKFASYPMQLSYFSSNGGTLKASFNVNGNIYSTEVTQADTSENLLAFTLEEPNE